MATNLRLRPDAEHAVRDEAARTGRSQQAVIRQAVDAFLNLGVDVPTRSEADALVAAGMVLPARSNFRPAPRLLALPEGASTLDLLDRDDRT